MAIDGSFSLEYALEKFLVRSPRLGCLPRFESLSSAVVTSQDIDMLGQLMLDLGQLHQRWQTIFMWHEGPLVQAMKDGSLFLVDEISLADDSVLERLNSVLEPERKLWFSDLQTGRMLNVRDLLSWVGFVNLTESSLGPDHAFLHGVFLILLDGLSLGTGMSKRDAMESSGRCLCFLLGNLKAHWRGHEAYSYCKRFQRAIIVFQCGWRYSARRELRMLTLAESETVALIEENNRLEKHVEELTWRLRLVTDLAEATSQMVVLIRCEVHRLQDSMQRLMERVSNLESENQVLRQQALATWPETTTIQRAIGNGNIANGEMKKVVDATRPKATIIQRATGNGNIANGEMKKVVDSPGQREVEGANYIFSKMGLKILLLQDRGD